MTRYRIEAQWELEVTDELALREAAFRATAAEMQNPKLLGMASSSGDPREVAGMDSTEAIRALVRTWRPDFSGVDILGGGTSCVQI